MGLLVWVHEPVDAWLVGVYGMPSVSCMIKWVLMGLLVWMDM